MKHSALMRALVSSGALTLSLGGAAYAAPCRPANPCAPRPASSRMNPCAARNPCAAKNPCAAAMTDRVDTRLVLRPKNYRPYRGKQAELTAYGKQLFGDTTLSSNGMSCNTCHQNNGAFQNTFAQPYPHYVQMTHDRSAVKAVHLDEMVQFCMVVPMASKPLPWSSKRLAALTAYTASLQKGFKAGANPCAAKNPCAARNPCAPANPCAPQRH
jgi:cytochrome c